MSVKDFSEVITKLQSFKLRLEKEGVRGKDQQIILKLFLEELTNNKVNTSMLKAI